MMSGMAAKKSIAPGNEGSSLLESLLGALRPLESVAVGFSGGVDSTVVVAAAAQALGRENTLAVTAASETLPARELAESRRLAAGLGIHLEVIRTRELDNPDFAANGPNRCYYCKTELWRRVRLLAREKGLAHVADGVNADDLGDFRPGITASDEAGVVHPLARIGAGKRQVRLLARQLGLENWDKPAQACLSSRFPYGAGLTPAALARVEQAEEFLRSQGFKKLRVRDHGSTARIEVPPSELVRLAASGLRQQAVSYFKKLGYTYVALDLEGFRSGSMNETLKP